MHIKSFLKLVEIQTKIASLVPFTFAVLFSLYYFKTIKPLQVLTFFLAMLFFDMFTTGLNNYMDYRRAIKREGFNYETHNAIVQFKLKETSVIIVLAILFALASVFGLITFFCSDYIVLILGIFCFSIGIIYSAGPVPVSRTFLGELFPGFFMGLAIPFIVVYISIYDKSLFSVIMSQKNLIITLKLDLLLPIIISSLPAMFLIANIMLANNICDAEDDLANKRYTLPVYIGTKKALILFDTLYILSFFDIIICVCLGYLPWISLLTIFFAIKVIKNVSEFHKLQTKKDTFGLSVMNLILVMAPLILSILIGIIIKT